LFRLLRRDKLELKIEAKAIKRAEIDERKRLKSIAADQRRSKNTDRQG